MNSDKRWIVEQLMITCMHQQVVERNDIIVIIIHLLFTLSQTIPERVTVNGLATDLVNGRPFSSRVNMEMLYRFPDTLPSRAVCVLACEVGRKIMS